MTNDISNFLGETSASGSGEEKLYSGSWLVGMAIVGGVVGFLVGSAVGSTAGLVVGQSKGKENELRRQLGESRGPTGSTRSSRTGAATETQFPVTEPMATVKQSMFGKMFAPSSGKTMVSAT
jgi:hypothetical protein